MRSDTVSVFFTHYLSTWIAQLTMLSYFALIQSLSFICLSESLSRETHVCIYLRTPDSLVQSTTSTHQKNVVSTSPETTDRGRGRCRSEIGSRWGAGIFSRDCAERISSKEFNNAGCLLISEVKYLLENRDKDAPDTAYVCVFLHFAPT